jgi:hypothetical protein
MGVVFYLNTALGTEFIKMANEAKWVLVFASALLIIIQFLDKVLVKRPGSTSSHIL